MHRLICFATPQTPALDSEIGTFFQRTRDISFCLLVAVGATACSSTERSRSLVDQNVAAITIATQVCSNCHGVTGVSTSPNFPVLAAQVEPYLVNQLTTFKSHDRSDPEGYEYMWGISAHLTSEQIAGLAHYYFVQSPAPAKPGDPTKLKEGKRIYETGIAGKGVAACVSCHGALAQGMENFPRLAGQHADYIIKQLQVFQQTNGRPAGAVMKVITHDMSATNMSEVAAYVQSLGPGLQ